MIDNLQKLEDRLSRPQQKTIEFFRELDGDIIILGISGKIGPSLAKMAGRASSAAGVKRKIFGVSRFGNEDERNNLENQGIETIAGDLLDNAFIEKLPRVKNVFFLAGMKFGSEENLSLTWAINSYMPGLIAEYYKDSRIAAFSTGCVYPMVKIQSGGSRENDKPLATGEYAQSCLGRERLFGYGSIKNKTKIILIRLNYAVELRYGVLVDIALKVKNRTTIDLSMGYFNIIWQGDANNIVLQSIAHAASPPFILNVTGAEIHSVREIAKEFGKRMNIKPVFSGTESDTALLSNPSETYKLFGPPEVPLDKMMDWITYWIMHEGVILDKPTKFEVRDGSY